MLRQRKGHIRRPSPDVSCSFYIREIQTRSACSVMVMVKMPSV